MIKLDDIKRNKDIITMVNWANRVLAALGYTDHGPSHVSYVSNTAADILKQLGYPQRTVELAAIAGWVHDIGNCMNRKHHGLTGANMIFPILLEMQMPMDEICAITSAIGHHEEENGVPVSEISSALIIADKSDAHRTRVRKGKYDIHDIHDRVNYAIQKTRLIIDKDRKIIRYEIDMDSTSSVMEFMEIYLSRMILCQKAASYLGCKFLLVVNDVVINNHIFEPNDAKLTKDEEVSA